MRNLPTSRPLRALSLLLMLALVTASAFLPVRAQAADTGSCLPVSHFTYYTNASKTVVCGWYDDCSGLSSGCRTAYYTKVFKACCQ